MIVVDVFPNVDLMWDIDVREHYNEHCFHGMGLGFFPGSQPTNSPLTCDPQWISEKRGHD